MTEAKKIEDMTDAEYALARLAAWCKLNPKEAAYEIEQLRAGNEMLKRALEQALIKSPGEKIIEAHREIAQRHLSR